MKIYLASPDRELVYEIISRFNPKPNVLLSYVNVGSHFSSFLHAYRPRLGSLMVDSGGYSDMAGTRKVELEPLTSFLGVCGHHFNYCINLDIEPENFDHRMWNMARINSAGLSVLPVIHDVFSGEIDQLYNRGYRYILIGSSHGNDPQQLNFIFNRYVYSGRFPEILFHKLGTATYATLSGYPFYSSDSAIFAHNAAYGRVMFWNESREPAPNGDRTDFFYFGGLTRWPRYHKHPHVGELEDYLWTTFHYRLSDLEGPQSCFQRQIVNVKYLLDLQDFLTRKHTT